MSIIEKFVDDLEVREAAEELFFSLYFIPAAYQPQELSYD